MRFLNSYHIALIIVGVTVVATAESCAGAEPYKSTADYYTQAFLGGKPYTPAVECGRKCYRSSGSGTSK